MANVHSDVGDSNPGSVPSDASLTVFQADMASIEVEMADRAALDSQRDEINEWDSVHCRVCGKISAGSDIAGCHVQACDGCIIEWVQQQIGVAL